MMENKRSTSGLWGTQAESRDNEPRQGLNAKRLKRFLQAGMNGQQKEWNPEELKLFKFPPVSSTSTSCPPIFVLRQQ